MRCLRADCWQIPKLEEKPQLALEFVEGFLSLSLQFERGCPFRLPESIDHILALEKTASRAKLRELVPARTELYCKVDVEVATGEPVSQILRIAQETKADLIVMGAKQRKSLAGNIPRTKAYRVVSERMPGLDGKVLVKTQTALAPSPRSS